MLSPHRPKAIDRRLPPILRKTYLESMSGYSKAAQGLFVLPYLIGVFTDSVISPGTLSRQSPDRSAFRAGRNFNCPNNNLKEKLCGGCYTHSFE